MECPRCQHENRPQATFCEACGTPLTANPRGPTAPSYADLSSEVESLRRASTETLEQQTATAEILRVIASSPTDIQPVLDAVAENAARVCAAYDATIFQVDGETLRMAAGFGPIQKPAKGEAGGPITRDWVTGRAVVDRCPVHVPDLAAAGEEYPRRSTG
jgi:two-component system, NtrC family, sensor kinase